ncbi:charged multivesicular body protein 7-like protein [Turdus rufiventris]|nr:charged multivesicular body protein 7-like protein [Turdus rufiventris]
MDSEELEKELDSLLQDSSKDSVDLPPAPQKVPGAPMSDAELEAELEQLSVCAGGGNGSRAWEGAALGAKPGLESWELCLDPGSES